MISCGAPVLIYSRDACSYCDKAKELFVRLGLAYREVRLDPNSEWYNVEKNVLYKVTKQKTFPFIFVGGEFIGGYESFLHASCTSLPGRLRKWGIVVSTDDF